MLNSVTLNSVYDLAQQATENNQLILIKDESPLTALVNACISPSIASGNVTPHSMEVSASDPTCLLGASRLKNSEGVSEHDLVMDELVETVSSAVIKNLSWARNEVAPMIDLVHTNAVKAIAGVSAAGLVPVTVIPEFLGGLWERPEIREMAANYATIPRQEIPLEIAVSMPEDKNVHDLIRTSLVGVDAEAHALAESLGQDGLQSVYDAFFSNARASTLEGALGLHTDIVSANRAVLAMLMANNLSQHVPDGLNMSLDAYKAYMAQLVSQIGSHVNRVLERQVSYQKNNVLVLWRPGSSDPRGDIHVNGPVYNRWLEAGGTPEILMGAVLANRETSWQGLLDHAEANQRAYAAILNSVNSMLQSAKLNALIKSFRDTMVEVINHLNDDDLPVPRSVLFANLAYRLTHVRASDLQDLDVPCRKVVCRTLWHHSDVERYLEAIEASAKAHPELDVRESALLAAIDVTVEWLMGQVTLAPAK